MPIYRHQLVYMHTHGYAFLHEYVMHVHTNKQTTPHIHTSSSASQQLPATPHLSEAHCQPLLLKFSFFSLTPS